MQQTCKTCKNSFEITEDDLKFYDKISPVFNGTKYIVPPPTSCPRCRQQRRLAFRGERNLYHRKCDKTGKALISLYSAEKPYLIYDVKEWWSDNFDPTIYGKNFDFSRPFFEQFNELMLAVPRMAINQVHNENCDFTSFTGFNKNCYMIYTADQNEGSMYGSYAFYNKDTLEFLFTHKSELCYEVTDARNCYNVFFGESVENCSDSIFIKDCIGCSNCIMCFGLRNKTNYVLNKPVSREEFLRIKSEVLVKLANYKEGLKREFQKFCLKFPHRATNIIKSENCTGDYISDSKNLENCFDATESQDCKYCSHIFKCKDSYDWDFYGDIGELGYELQSTANHTYNCIACTNSWGANSYVLYSDLSQFCENCFGCVSLRHKKYCILNKQYTKEEYENLMPKIIEHMKKTGEWGEFFPISISPFGYNETVAYEHYPITKEQALKIKAKWKEVDKLNQYQGPKVNPPADIKEVKNEITKQILTCDSCGKNYRIILQELNFYRKTGLPIPWNCPDCRHKARMELRNPRKLFDRSCAKCGVDIKTTYSPERSEIVYCEACYLKEVY